MNVRIKTIGDTPLPVYETDGAVAFDFRAREESVIEPQSLGFIPTGLIIEVPDGHALLLAARSSTPKKKGLLIPHGMGIIDQDYCGPGDELFLQYYNFTDAPVVIEEGERCGQGLIVRIDRAEWEPTEEIREETRGGFGSTGQR